MMWQFYSLQGPRLMPWNLDAGSLALVAATSFFAAIIGGVGGFGTGIILTALLAPVIGFKALVPVLAVAGVVVNAGRFWFYRRSVDLRAAKQVLAGAVPALFAGAYVYSLLDARTIGLVLGTFVLAAVPLRHTLAMRGMHLRRAGVVFGAGVFGLVSGIASATGVILISLLLGAGLGGTAVLATDALVSIAIDFIKVLLFGQFDLLDAGNVTLGLTIGAATIPGSRVAAWLVERLGARLHVLAMDALIVVGGVTMLWSALTTA